MHTLPRVARGLALVLGVFFFAAIFSPAVRADCISGKCTDSSWASSQGTLSKLITDQSGGLKLDYDFGDGHDGDLQGGDLQGNFQVGACEVNSISGTCVYTDCGGTIMNPGDDALIVDMRGSNAGAYQVSEVVSGGASTICFKDTITLSASDTIYVQELPQYNNAYGTITWGGWQTSPGISYSGIIAFKAKGTFSGTVNVDGLGYKGGDAFDLKKAGYEYPGESLTGVGSNSSTAANGGGGGGGQVGITGHTGSGGGGEYTGGATPGSGGGGPGAVGGTTPGSANYLKLGSGGGGGGFNYLASSTVGGNGGNGGGAILIYARTISGGSASAKGADGTKGTGGSGSGGGGGSGGTAIITSQSGSLTPDVSGGAGGAAGGSNGHIGGNGGSGYYAPGTASLYSSGSYVSQVFDVSSQFTGSRALWLNVTASTSFPSGGQLKISYYICPDSSCSSPAWVDCGTFTSGTSAKCDLPSSATGNYLQYKLDFTKGSGTASTPSVNSISLQYKNSDSTLPNMWITTSPASLSLGQWSKDSITATIHCSDTGGSGCDTTSFLYYNPSSATTSCSNAQSSYTSSDFSSGSDPQSDGSNGATATLTMSSTSKLCVAAKDLANNWNYTKMMGNFSIDKTAPTLAIGNESTSWTKSNNITLKCTDPGGSGCQAAGIYYSFVSTQDSSSCSSCTGTPVNTGGVLVGSGATLQGASGDHNNYLCACAKDTAGNAVSAVSNQLMVDATAPTASSDADQTKTYSANAAIKLSCQDSLSGCKTIYYCIADSTGTCTPTTALTGSDLNFDGTVQVNCASGMQTCTKIIKYYADDKAGNKIGSASSPLTTQNIKIDTSTPSCTMTALNTYTTTSSITLGWTSKPAVTGASAISSVLIQSSTDGSSFSDVYTGSATGTTTFTGAQNGIKYYFQCIATDAKNTQSAPNVVSTTVKIGTEAVNIASSSGALVNSTSFTFTWSSDEPAIANFTLYYKEGTATSGSWSACKTFPSSGLSVNFGSGCSPQVTPANNKTYSFKVKMMDTAGNSKESDSISVMVDTKSPTCAIASLPAYQPNSSTSFDLSLSGNDGESGIDKFVVEQRMGITGPWTEVYRDTSPTYTVTTQQDGFYSFRCKAIDKAGNMGDVPLSTQWRSTTVDTSPPEIDASFNGTVESNDTLTIKATVSDSVAVSNVSLTFDGKIVNGTLAKSNQSSWIVTWKLDKLVATGEKSFTIDVADANGNVKSTPYTFLVSTCNEDTTQKCGACGSGTKTCKDGGWTACSGEDKSLVTPEVCDGIDNDCVGGIDDVNGGTSVESTKCGCYGKGLIAATQEICDGIDNDCNGLIDDGAKCCTQSEPCSKNVGICKKGVKPCNPDGSIGQCDGVLPNPGGKICSSSLDNDCNGVPDNQEPDCVAKCADSDGDGYGSPPSASCAGGMQTDCDDSDPTVYPGAPATCTGTIKDNNCDGSTDDEIATCNTCSNNKLDGNEEGVDCGGDCAACFQWGWLYLTGGGVVILLILVYVWLHLKRQGREMSWEELQKKWNPSE